VAGEKDGTGTMEYGPDDSLNRTRYEGEWKHNQFYIGTLTWKNGSSYQGQFENDVENGYGLLYDVKRGNYTGKFVQGKRDGMYGNGVRLLKSTIGNDRTKVYEVVEEFYGTWKNDKKQQGSYKLYTIDEEIRHEFVGALKNERPYTGNYTKYKRKELLFYSVDCNGVTESADFYEDQKLANNVTLKRTNIREQRYWFSELVGEEFSGNVTVNASSSIEVVDGVGIFPTDGLFTYQFDDFQLSPHFKKDDFHTVRIVLYKENNGTVNGSMDFETKEGKHFDWQIGLDGEVEGPFEADLSDEFLEEVEQKSSESYAEFVLDNGDTVKGYFENGQINQGTITHADKVIYEGTFSDGRFVGTVKGHLNGLFKL
jgi:hypothetical protein